MKIRDLLGEAGGAIATIKDYKPGQTLSFADPTGSTMTTIDLKKNPMAVKPDDQGKLTYDPTPDSTAATPGQSSAPDIKPGAQIQIDTATTEGNMDELASELGQIADEEDYDKLYNLIGDNGPIGDYLQSQLQDIRAETGLHPKDDFERIEAMLMNRVQKEFGEESFGEEDKPVKMDESSYITALAKRITHTEGKTPRSDNRSVYDIKRLAGL